MARRLPYPIFVRNIISQTEENAIIKYINKPLSRKKYEGSHWDDVIQRYKEIELHSVPNEINMIFERIRNHIHHVIQPLRPKPIRFIAPHVIDLGADGHIGAHVDSIKFSGDIVAALSLVSPRILRLRRDDTYAGNVTSNVNVDNGNVGRSSYGSNGLESTEVANSLANQLLPPPAMIESCEPLLEQTYEFQTAPRCLYILHGDFRYHYTHEILGKGSEKASQILSHRRKCIDSTLGFGHDRSDNGIAGSLQHADRYERRLSIIFRDEL